MENEKSDYHYLHLAIAVLALVDTVLSIVIAALTLL